MTGRRGNCRRTRGEGGKQSVLVRRPLNPFGDDGPTCDEVMRINGADVTSSFTQHRRAELGRTHRNQLP